MSERRPSRSARVLAAAWLVVAIASVSPAKKPPAKKKVDYRTPPRKYRDVALDGRIFRVEEQLLVEAPALARQAVARLKKNIDQALAILPAHSHPYLTKQRFYLMYGPRAKGGGRTNGLEYFRPGSPRYDATRDPDWNSVIVVWNAKNYTRLSDLWALKAVVHEFAHAYHLEQWPEKQPDILAAYQKAMKAGLYRHVKHDEGGKVKAGYATANQLEYFAETSCMFFARCNYAPHDRVALEKYDPAACAMLRKLWQVGKDPRKRKPGP